MPARTILVVDDEKFVRDSLVALLEAEGFRALGAASAPAALEVLARERIDAIATDLQMPGGGGQKLLEEARASDPELPVVILTGVGTVRDAVLAMRAGAYDFIQKPIEPDQFVLLLRRALERRDLVTEVRHLRHAVRDLRGPPEMVGASEAMRQVRAAIAQVAPSDATVLVTGESGTGKELVAQAIHARSARADGPLVRMNCAAIPETLFESELFGHRRGAFTGASEDRVGRFAEAARGTLVLDEIGTIRPGLQAKLLRVLESGEFQVVGESRSRVADVRVVAVTNEDLEARVREGAFRADLYYRLDIFPIRVPPLRERKEDIPPLARHFLDRLGRSGAPPRDAELTPEALGVLAAYDWPGNVRELRNIIERAAILAGAERLTAALFRRILGPPAVPSAAPAATPDDTAPRFGSSAARPAGAADHPSTLHIRTRVEALEKELIRQALAVTEGRKREAAEMLGIDPRNIAYYIRKHGLGEPRPEDDGA